MKVWQRLMRRWQYLVFGDLPITPHVRALRLLEEVMELCQAENVTEEELGIILRQVYDKPVGHPFQEAGGVASTLVAYIVTRGWDLEDVFFTEFERMIDPKIIEKVRFRNLEGDKIGLKDAQR